MNKQIKNFLVGMIAVLLLSSCHFMQKKAEFSNLGSSKRGLASLFNSVLFVNIPAGSFEMGDFNKKVPVEITRTFQMMETEVTQKQWSSVMRYNPSYFNKPEYCDNYDWFGTLEGKVEMCPDNPVENVSYSEVQEFISKINENTGELCSSKELRRKNSGCLRLPTEAEWEYSVRANTHPYIDYFFGNDPLLLNTYAVYSKNSKQSQKVRSKKKNPWGLYDMYGNVWEYVQDTWSESLPGGTDPLFIREHFYGYVIRGGSYYSLNESLKSSSRFMAYPEGKSKYIGFRLVRTL
ncbi:MAG: formylglycine-generating enzyme family protein [Bdellovibrionaceae bacterium]|nr:formylglycine-generating enzyme family protein [Pseudobdellovibrionaceae bacterium]